MKYSGAPSKKGAAGALLFTAPEKAGISSAPGRALRGLTAHAARNICKCFRNSNKVPFPKEAPCACS